MSMFHCSELKTASVCLICGQTLPRQLVYEGFWLTALCLSKSLAHAFLLHMPRS